MLDEGITALGSPSQAEEIFILPVSLLDTHRPQVAELKRLAASLGIGPGWHYLLDWTWILDKLGGVGGKRILDAGAGTGLLQWYLAEHAADVISVDRSSRSELSLRFRARYNIRGLRTEDLSSSLKVLQENVRQSSGIQAKIPSLLRGTAGLVKIALPKSIPGRVTIYNHDLTQMADIPDNSIDAVVAVSALEHNSPDSLDGVVTELVRVLKPGGVLLATLGAARDHDWFHEPSKGWCYTETSLRRFFTIPDNAPSNFADYDALMNSLVKCRELSDNLASFYFHSGDNGMPWGKWNPQYQPVGVCKLKEISQ